MTKLGVSCTIPKVNKIQVEVTTVTKGLEVLAEMPER
jgi:hypothetical protein